MASTYTTYANLEKFEDRAVGWDNGANMDKVDQGISLHNMTASENLTAFDLVTFDTAGANTVRQAQVTAAGDELADGIVPAAISSAATGTVLTRGFATNGSWAWTRGDVLYLTTTAGGLAVRGTTHIAESTAGEEIIIQPVGIATSATRAFFDFTRRPGHPYTIASNGYTVSAGSAPETFGSVTGPGSIRRLTAAVGASVVFGFRLPGWFRAFPNISGIWGFRLWYKAAATGTIDIDQIYNGNNGAADPGISAGTSTSWAALDLDWNTITDSGLSFVAGDSVYIRVTVATAAVEMEVVPALRFEPIAQLATK